MPRIRVRPDALLEVGEDPGDRLARLDHHVGEEQADQDAVALGDVPADGKAAGLLPAEQRVGLHHLRGDVLEPDRHLIHALAVLGPELVHHRRHVYGLDHGSAHAARLEQVEHQQREYLELVDEASGLVDDAHAVGVAVGADAQVLAADLHERDRGIDVGRDRLRVDAAEQWVPLVVQLGHGRPASADHLGDVSVPRPIHAFVDETEARVLDRVHVDHARDLRVVRGARVVRGHEPVRDGSLGRRHVLERVDVALELGDDLGRDGAARLGLVLVAVELVGVMAGGDGHRPGGLAVDDRPRGYLGRRRAVEDQRLDAVGREDRRHRLGEILGGKPAVVADDRERLARPRLHVLRRALRHPAQIAEGEVVGDDASPSISAELDLLSAHFA